MSFYYPYGAGILEPTQGNVRQWLDSLWTKFNPIEQSRWNEANLDSLFYAGNYTAANNMYRSMNSQTFSNYYFNIIKQPCDFITGYQRQHRKGFLYIPTEGSDPQTTDQYTRLITHVANDSSIHEQYSKGTELSMHSGMVLLQPYLDFTGDDPLQGTAKLKIWEYNTFIADPWFRDPSGSDSNLWWMQEYISRFEAVERFPNQADMIARMASGQKRYGSFYFLPESFNINRNDLLVISYVWYKAKRRKKRLYSRKSHQFFDFSGGDEQIEKILYGIPDLEVVEVDVPTWKLATVLNDQLMFNGFNPLGVDTSPVIPCYWNYEPHLSDYRLRVRSYVYPLRSPQVLFNHKVINNNDLVSATLNSGWKRKSGAVANEENLKQTQNGMDIIINEGYELTDCEKIQPTILPESDLALAEQMKDLSILISSISVENWAAMDTQQISSLTLLLKQASSLLVFQKYFDQWDYVLKLVGDALLNIILTNWSPEKIGLYLGEEPSPFFYSRIFCKYQMIVEESLLTPTQKNLQAQQMMDINTAFGREVFPPSMIVKDMNLSGKAEMMEFLQGQEQQQAAIQEHATTLQHTVEEAKLKELYSKVASNIAMAKERYGRFESNIGLLEERMAEVSKNRALSTKAKMEALEKLIDVIGKYGEIETSLKMNEIESFDYKDKAMEDSEKSQAHKEAASNEFLSKMMNEASIPQMGGEQQPPQM